MKTSTTSVFNNNNAYIISSKYLVTDISTGFLKLTGYCKDEIGNMDISKVFANILRLSEDLFRQIQVKGSINCYIFTKTLKVRSVTIYFTQSKYSKNKRYMFVERLNSRLDDKLIFAEQLFDDNIVGAAIYSVPGLILLKSNQKYLNFINAPLNTMEDSIGRTFREFANKGGRESIFNTVLETQESRCVKGSRHDQNAIGVTYWDYTITPIFENKELKYIYEVCTEVTDHVLAKMLCVEQDKLIESQKELLDTVIENIPDPFTIYDYNGNLVKINAAGSKLYPQLDIQDTIGDFHSAFEYFDLEGKEISSINLPVSKVLRGEIAKNVTIVIKRKDREQVTEINATPIYDKDNKLVSITSFHHDITETVQNQRLIKDQQDYMLQIEIEKNEVLRKSNEMKDEFLSIISHEFKTPLTIINAAIEAMEFLCKDELSEKAKGFINKIQQNANRQIKLVNNLLDITRINAGHLKINKIDLDIVSITRTITESIKIYAEQKGIKLSFYSTLGKKVMGIDEEKYERILLNLLSNAVKFTPKGKSVTVKVSQKTIKGKRKVIVQVKDKGIGIPYDKRDLIFERFGQVDSSLTRQAEGTGIGLSLVKMFVEAHGGEITLESKEGMGSLFTIILPSIKVKYTPVEHKLRVISENRLIQAKTIEFSGVY